MAKKPKLTGRNYPHTKMLTLKEWRRFKKLYDRGYSGFDLSLKEYLIRHKNESFYNFMFNAFNFSETGKDENFWYNVMNRTKPVS